MILKLRLTFLLFSLSYSALIAQITISDYVINLDFPVGMTIDADGNLYVAEGNGGNIIKATAPLTSSVFVNTGWNNRGLSIDNNGDFFVGEGLFGQIFKITPDGTQTSYIGISDTDDSPWKIYFDANNNMYYSNVFGEIVKVTPNKVFSDYATGFLTPEGFDFDSNGNLFVAARNEGKFIKVEPNGTKTTLLNNQYDIRAVAIDANDDVYFNVRQGFSTYKILKYKQSDGTLEDIVVTGIENVNDMIFNDQGDLFIAHDDKVSIAKSVVTLAIDDITAIENNFQVYPNPASNLVYIPEDITNFKIYDSTSKIIISGVNKNNTIDVSSLKHGVYLISLEDYQNNLSSKRFVKI